ncbi:hypothetical protein QVD17_39285 [Tagetes erecta]|uniref:Uncharacterized protein n=1 Tax=Tagetes erecta TaxID=13708 RepID=A0AAD8JN99_TARER|nr:hypothetical protein QVD17_39285 [Tagetes erecta]
MTRTPVATTVTGIRGAEQVKLGKLMGKTQKTTTVAVLTRALVTLLRVKVGEVSQVQVLDQAVTKEEENLLLAEQLDSRGYKFDEVMDWSKDEKKLNELSFNIPLNNMLQRSADEYTVSLSEDELTCNFAQ